MTGQVENTRMTPMQTLDSLKNQINADGKVTQEEIQMFGQKATEMVAKKEISMTDFNEAIGWFKNDTITTEPDVPKEPIPKMSKTDELLKAKERNDSIEQVEAKYQSNYEKLGIEDLKKELRKKQEKFNELAKVIGVDPKKDQDRLNTLIKKGTIVGGIAGAIAGLIGIEKYHWDKIESPILSLRDGLPENQHFHLEIPEYKNLSEGVSIILEKRNMDYETLYEHCFLPDDVVKRGMHANRNRLIAVGIGLVLGGLAAYGISKLLFKPETEETKQQKIQQMRELEPQIQELEQKIKTLEAQC